MSHCDKLNKLLLIFTAKNIQRLATISQAENPNFSTQDKTLPSSGKRKQNGKKRFPGKLKFRTNSCSPNKSFIKALFFLRKNGNKMAKHSKGQNHRKNKP
jgi:hypothetical protein